MKYFTSSVAMATIAILLTLGLPGASPAQAQDITSAYVVPERSSGPGERFLDRSSLVVNTRVGTSSNDYRYGLTVYGRFYGYGMTTSDAVKVSVKLGNAEVAEARCRIEPPSGTQPRHGRAGGLPAHDGFGVGQFACQTDQTIAAVGELEVGLTYIDDGDDREIAMAPLRVPVSLTYTYRPPYTAQPYVDQSDRVGAASLLLRGGVYGRPKIMFGFWANPKHEMRSPDSSSLGFRCYVNGERVRKELAVAGSFLHPRGGNLSPNYLQNGDRDQLGQSYYELATRFTYRGQGGYAGDMAYELTDHPGDYRCELRVEGEPVREFRFTVAPDGAIPQHPARAAEDGLWLPPFARLVDVRFPNPTTWDRGLPVSAMRGSVLYGRTWPEGSAEMRGAWPRRDAGSVGVRRPRGRVEGPRAARRGRRGRR